ncbi:Translation initiation factor IF3-1, mitochondrial [Sesamum angolense]|uniref:Translation initiation factor IF3-1, mitochondrial n=1 Tax=Sesamum angolense TaxID=2727404 RepID=A0AAE2BXH4_9LAMI|nr:Translation initiation factor IF3-1, mitochondrial [Sesamum angolense]
MHTFDQSLNVIAAGDESVGNSIACNDQFQHNAADAPHRVTLSFWDRVFIFDGVPYEKLQTALLLLGGFAFDRTNADVTRQIKCKDTKREEHLNKYRLKRKERCFEKRNKCNQLEFFCKVRSYAAPVQAYQKKKERDTSGPRLNEQITAPLVRLVGDEGHCVVSRYEALARAKSLKMDLVEVDKLGKPPVCKILDYHKEKYVQEVKEKERAKSKSTLKKAGAKEVRFAAKICTAIEPTEAVDLETLLSRFCALIEDVAVEESGPRVEKKQAYVVVRHIKFGPLKKGSGKKASKTAVTSKTDVQTGKSKSAVFSGDDDIHSVFDIDDEENGLLKSSKDDLSATLKVPSPYSVDRNPRHVVESAPTSARAMENRYARDPKSARPSRVPTDANGHGGRNTMNSAPQFPNQGGQPQFSMNTSSQTRPPTRQVEVPAYDSKQESPSSSTLNSPKKGYGIFS